MATVMITVPGTAGWTVGSRLRRVEGFFTVMIIASGGLATWLAGYATYRLSCDEF